MGNPSVKFLDLDDLDTSESDITIKHKGVEHRMRVLTVDAFIAQQKRAVQQQKMAEEAESVGDSEMVQVVELIKASILEFFPTLPVGELETPKLFIIFGFMNDLSAQINEAEAPSTGEGVEPASAEGNVEAVSS